MVSGLRLVEQAVKKRKTATGVTRVRMVTTRMMGCWSTTVKRASLKSVSCAVVGGDSTLLELSRSLAMQPGNTNMLSLRPPPPPFIVERASTALTYTRLRQTMPMARFESAHPWPALGLGAPKNRKPPSGITSMTTAVRCALFFSFVVLVCLTSKDVKPRSYFSRSIPRPTYYTG
jgi:hypothetical protein